MEYRLSGSFVDIDSYIISVWMISFIYLLFHILKHYIHCFSFMISQIEIGCYMSFRNYQSMTWRYRITIIKCDTCNRLTNNLHLS